MALLVHAVWVWGNSLPELNTITPVLQIENSRFVSIRDTLFDAVKPDSDVEKLPADPNGLVWLTISDPGVPGQKGFNGQMSKHEITNAQYCQFLNSLIATGKIVVDADGYVYAIEDTTFSQRYFYTFTANSNSQIAYSNGLFQVRSRDGHTMADHPVTYVSWYGAIAFCNYYGYRLPSEWEWQGVADYDGSYAYGCGTTINQSIANYNVANPLSLSSFPYTTPVDSHLPCGYGLVDMAGNVWEWTSSVNADNQPAIRGGSWLDNDSACAVSNRFNVNSLSTNSIIGFRVCR
jgi:formylglycine-generating enzyme required for sulfatase activity